MVGGRLRYIACQSRAVAVPVDAPALTLVMLTIARQLQTVGAGHLHRTPLFLLPRIAIASTLKSNILEKMAIPVVTRRPSPFLIPRRARNIASRYILPI